MKELLDNLNAIIDSIKSLVKEDETADYTDFKIAGERLLQSLPRNKDEKEIVIDVILKYFNMTMEQVTVTCRKQEFVFPRQLVHNFVKKYTKISLQAIADITGQEHATVLNSIKTINNYIESNDKEKKRVIEYIEYKILLALGRDPEMIVFTPIKKEKVYSNSKKVFQNIPNVNGSMFIQPRMDCQSKFAKFAMM